MRKLRWWGGVVLLLTLSACSGGDDKPLTLTVNAWVGYTPLMYAQEQGWLDELPVELVFVGSLGESLRLYRQGLSDGFAGTQYEGRQAGLSPAILLDRSNGADQILANQPLAELAASNQEIEVYLERDSVNTPLFEAFAARHLPKARFRLHDSNPTSLALLSPQAAPLLVVSYEPYSSQLHRQGLLELASTRDVELLVLDALFVDAQAYQRHHATLLQLQRLSRRALADLRSDPRAFHARISHYLEGQGFAEFSQSVSAIEWLLDTLPSSVIAVMQAQGIDTSLLIPPQPEAARHE